MQSNSSASILLSEKNSKSIASLSRKSGISSISGFPMSDFDRLVGLGSGCGAGTNDGRTP